MFVCILGAGVIVFNLSITTFNNKKKDFFFTPLLTKGEKKNDNHLKHFAQPSIFLENKFCINLRKCSGSIYCEDLFIRTHSIQVDQLSVSLFFAFFLFLTSIFFFLVFSVLLFKNFFFCQLILKRSKYLKNKNI